jgi:integrase
VILKAALNYVWQEGKVASDEEWRRVKPFKGVDASRVRYLAQAECSRLINACDPNLRLLVQAALFTGCRYGELAAAKVNDFDPDSGTLFIGESKSGKVRHVVLTDEGRKFFKRAAAGKLGDQIMFLRGNGRPWGKSHQNRPLAVACDAASIAPRVSFHILRHSYASQLVMNGVPLGVVSKNLGHADTRMTERHYAHLASSYVADEIRAGAPELGIAEEDNVTPLPVGGGGG